MTLINVSAKARMETVDFGAYPDSLIDGQESWNVYELVVTNGINPVSGTATDELQVWVKRGEMLTKDDAQTMCDQIG